MAINKSTLSQTSKSLLKIIDKWNRSKGLNKEIFNEQDVKSLLTVNLIAEELEKEPLTAQYKKHDVVVKSLIELSERINNDLPSIFMCPFLLESKDHEIIVRIAVAVINNESNIASLRKSCFNLSIPAIKLFFSNYTEEEINTNKYNEYKLSISEQFSKLLSNGFKPYPYIKQDLFIEDFINYGVKKELLFSIWNHYCILSKQYSNKTFAYHFKEVCEIIESFLLNKIKPLDNLSKTMASLLNEYQSKFSSVEILDSEKKCNEEKLQALLEVADYLKHEAPDLNLSYKQEQDLVKKMNDGYNIIYALKALFDKTFEQEDYDSNELFEAIVTKINQHTEEYLDFYELDLISFLKEQNLGDIDYLTKIKSQLLSNLNANTNIIFKKIPNKSNYICADAGYLEAISKNLDTQLLQEQNPEFTLFKLKVLNSENLKLKKFDYTNSKITTEILEELERKNQAINEELLRSPNQLFGSFNIKAFIGSFIAMIVGFNLLSYIIDRYVISIIGLFLSLGASVLLGFLIKNNNTKPKGTSKSIEKKPLPKKKNTNQKKPPSAGETEKSKKSNLMRKLVIESESTLFPKDFKKIEDKIYDIESLRDKLKENLDNIKQKLKSDLPEEFKNDPESFLANLEHSALQNIARINIPPNVRAEGKPLEVLIAQKDLKFELSRNQIAEHYRTLLDRNKSNKKLFKYYQFIINSIELEYYKYLPKGI